MSEPLGAHEREERPHPIYDEAKGFGTIVTALGTIITAVAAFGAINTEQAGALHELLTVLAPVAAAATGLVASFGVARKAEPHVTPLVNPCNDAGVSLIPVDNPPASPTNEPTL